MDVKHMCNTCSIKDVCIIYSGLTRVSGYGSIEECKYYSPNVRDEKGNPIGAEHMKERNFLGNNRGGFIIDEEEDYEYQDNPHDEDYEEDEYYSNKYMHNDDEYEDDEEETIILYCEPEMSYVKKYIEVTEVMEGMNHLIEDIAVQLYTKIDVSPEEYCMFVSKRTLAEMCRKPLKKGTQAILLHTITGKVMVYMDKNLKDNELVIASPRE